MNRPIKELRNIAIIAHVDHGKTTLVDALLKQSSAFRENETVEKCAMDSNDLERERGITILAKNTAISYTDSRDGQDYRINIVDTPGHADFGGEVERILKMVDAVILIVDAYDGPMPQTRFVLSKALGLGLPILVVINKCDRKDARPYEVQDLIFDLFIELGADDEQTEFPILFASGRQGIAGETPEEVINGQAKDIKALFEMIIDKVPCPVGDDEGGFQLLVSNIESDPYVGRLAIGKIERGTIKMGQTLSVARYGSDMKQSSKVTKLMRFEALHRVELAEASVGEIVCVAGSQMINIGDTLCSLEDPEPLPFVDIDEPTIAMTFTVNDSPFAGKEGKYLTSRHIRDRLFKERERNVAMRVEETDSPDAYVVKGRGELHLSILIETMRREGYEFQVSRPEVIVKETENGKVEPLEELFIDTPEEYVGTVMSKLGPRKAELRDMYPMQDGYTRLTFRIPSRGLIGYRTEFLTDTRGNGIMNSMICGYTPWQGTIETRTHGVITARETGQALTYGLYNAQERGTLFVTAGTDVYEGMVVGMTPKIGEVSVNVCKKKHVTNMRASGADEALRLVPATIFSLEQCMEFVADDELIEVTPLSIRIRKKILNSDLRAKTMSRLNKNK